ncbi:hypothetical protein CH330_05135 [candidate division WOR-3 bacterium JGI_Cruoil_03_51_56]|uniref:Zinc resistance-associated protein n=1 Tax=candidate division WOR-3 bacterium JGI_Cruoil_03_51_56 TaxID=1973747 RepID=A0A235BTH8_UNCW3|nr:MAG: hypothetical protein CH330_05135 [candidate division WOR-3 bacterium JGI_Cruoil_03_51_56]
MKTWTKWLIVALAVSVAVNIAALGVFVYHHAVRRQMGPMWHGMKPEKKSEVRSVRLRFKPRMDSLRHEMKMVRRELLWLLREPEPDPKEVDLRLDAAARIQKEMNRVAFESARMIGAKLPPEQRARMLRRFERQFGPPSPGRPRRRNRRQIPKKP